MPFPADAPAHIHNKMVNGRLPLERAERMFAGYGSGKICDGCDQPIGSQQVEYEFVLADGRTFHLHLGCASLLEAERRRSSR